MAVRDIVIEGDPVLRQKARNVRQFGPQLQALFADMYETLESANGVGLAGPQIGVPERLIVIIIPDDLEDDPAAGTRIALANPEIIKAKGEELGEEGCLSLPGFYGEVPRAAQVVVKGRDASGKEVRVKAYGFYARVLQHEIDHLEGILFTDKMTPGTLHYEGQEDLPAPDELTGKDIAAS